MAICFKHKSIFICTFDLAFVQIRTMAKKVVFKQFRRKNDAEEIAKDYFDMNYVKLFQNDWPAIRCALLSRKKYSAVLNNFVNIESYEEQLLESGAYDFITHWKKKAEIKEEELQELVGDVRNELKLLQSSISEHHEIEENELESEIDNKIDELQERLENLNIEIANYKRLKTICSGVKAYVHPKGSFVEFKPTMENFLYFSFLLDGSSILPVLALDPRPSDFILDMCSAPGAKLNVMIQALGTTSNIVANEILKKKLNGIKNVFNQFYPRSSKISDCLNYSITNATEWTSDEAERYSKVLVDVPCISDRKSMYTPERDVDNIFSESRKRERGSLPELQSLLLLNAIRCCQVGGSVVYTTSTASPLQNQYVVQFTVQEALQSHGIVCEVDDLTPLANLLDDEFHFKKDIDLGILVVPRLDANFGPTYVCKLKRLT